MNLKGLMGTYNRQGTKQQLPTEDSSVKKAMKGVMKLSRKNMPKMPVSKR
jgi:hypothetical protein